MKTRVISAAVALVLLAAAMYFYRTVAFEILIALITAIGVYEMCCAVGMNKTSIPTVCMSTAFAFIFIFREYKGFNKYFPVAAIILLLAVFVIQLKNFSTQQFKDTAFCIMSAILIPLSFSSLVLMKMRFTGYAEGMFYILLALAGAWIPDTGAYFAGRLFGKRKLCPQISPKKTVEGAIGGFISGIIFFVLYGFVFSRIAGFNVNYLYLVLLSPIVTAVSIIGDLSASVIKRQVGIKDYGKIMPGHGGVMDRFDSVLFTAPVTYIFISFLPIVF